MSDQHFAFNQSFVGISIEHVFVPQSCLAHAAISICSCVCAIVKSSVCLSAFLLCFWRLMQALSSAGLAWPFETRHSMQQERQCMNQGCRHCIMGMVSILVMHTRAHTHTSISMYLHISSRFIAAINVCAAVHILILSKTLVGLSIASAAETATAK